MKLILLLLVATLATVNASRLFSDGLDILAARQLLQTTTGNVYAACPSNCDSDNGKCTFDSSAAGYKCIKCLNNLVVVRGRCACPAGRYLDSGNQRCLDCPLNSWCPGGIYDQAQPDPSDNKDDAVRNVCTNSLITRAKRSRTRAQCVNPPGSYFTTTDPGCTTTAPCAVTCSSDTFSPGLLRQKQCTPCPTGFKTNGGTGLTSSQACKVPPGYYLKTPGQVAPCPKGQYQDSWVAPNTAVGKCTPCGVGITTDVPNTATAQTACKATQAGYAPVTADSPSVTYLTAAVKCPQNFYCPGGIVTAVIDINSPTASSAAKMSACTVNGITGLWTQGVGATSIDECMVPPGFGVSSSSISQCTLGQYREGWLLGNLVATANCQTCGSGINGVQSDVITQYTYNPTSNDYDPSDVNVASTSGNCYISAGMGMYTGGGGYRAVNCTQANAQYGVASDTYGLAANPCKPCSTGLTMTDTSAAGHIGATGGITSADACVTKPGWGWDGRVSTECPKGSWAIGGDLSPCTDCGFGLTTVASGSNISTNCNLAQGYGNVGGTIQLCPLGYYNNQDGLLASTTDCSTCPLSTTSTEVGAVDPATDCDACPAGTGAAVGNFAAGCTTCSGGTYGPSRQSVDVQTDQSCQACPTSATGFQFFWNGTEYPYQAPPTSDAGATSSGGCLASFAQITDGLWYFGTGSAISGTSTAGDADIATCLAQCTGTCQFATYDYAALSDKCTLYSASGTGAILAYKAVPSGDIYAAAQSVKAKSATASGLYTQWTVDSALSPLPGVSSVDAGTLTQQECFASCDNDAECAAVFYVVGSSSCKRLYGVSMPGATNAAKRSLTRAVPSQAS